MKPNLLLTIVISCLVPISSWASTSSLKQKKIATVKTMYNQSNSPYKNTQDDEWRVDDQKALYNHASPKLRKALNRYKKYASFDEYMDCREIYPSLYFSSEMRDDFADEKISSYRVLKNGQVRVVIDRKTVNGKKLKYINDFSLYCSSHKCQITDLDEGGNGSSLIKAINQSCK